MKLDLDKFELLYYLEGCARGSHLRQGVWSRCIDEFYDKLNDKERNFVFHYSVRDLWPIFNEAYPNGSYHIGREDFNMFIARFNPYNKYHLVCSNGDAIEEADCFWYDGRFHINYSRIAADEYIKSIEWEGLISSEQYDNDYRHLSYDTDGRVLLKPPYENC